MNTLHQVVDKCLRKVQHFQKKGLCEEVRDFVLLNSVIRFKQDCPNLREFLMRTAYDGGPSANSKCIVELKSEFVSSQDATSTSLYKPLFGNFEQQLMTAVKHDLDFVKEKTFTDFMKCCGEPLHLLARLKSLL